ncbi:MAG: hypothetical protein WD003_02695 [Candidatus Paceibacterota bacterium]
MKKKYSKGEIAKIILISMAIIGMGITFIALPGTAYIFQLFKPKNGQDKHRIRQSLHGLEKNNFVRRYNKNGQEFIELTSKGKQKVYKYQIDEISLKKKKKWDGEWVLIAFDIPENKKGARNALSRKLKEIGCYPLQKSLFAYPYECKEEIDFVTNYFKVSKYVYYMKVRDIEGGDGKLKKHFNLR